MQAIVIANLKGGVGKTVTAHALASVLASIHQRRVLLVDMDPQASLTAACGIKHTNGRSLVEVLGGETWGKLPLDAVIREIGPGQGLVPSNPLLRAVEHDLEDRIRREVVLRDALTTVFGDRRLPENGERVGGTRYDVVIIDTPPSLGLLTINSLVAADGVLIPCRPEFLSLQSLRAFMRRLEDIVQAYNRRLRVIGVLPTFYEQRVSHHRSTVQTMRAMGYPVLDVCIGRSIRIAEASEAEQSVTAFAPDNARALEYMVLGSLVNAWLQEGLQEEASPANQPSARPARVATLS